MGCVGVLQVRDKLWLKKDAGLSLQVRVKGRHQGNVCGPHKAKLGTTARGEPLVGTPIGGP